MYQVVGSYGFAIKVNTKVDVPMPEYMPRQQEADLGSTH